jgi:2-phosphosulfolactate phosphatase
MQKKKFVDVCLSPKLYPTYHRDDAIVVVIDVLRATSAMCAAFENGVERIIPVASVEEATSYKQQGFIVGAERNGIPLEGFDFGNSPESYSPEKIKGKTIVISTTNGTQAIDVSRNAYQVVIGAFTNITALCNWLAQQDRHVVLLASGWKNRFNIEDSLFAGAVAERLLVHKDKFRSGDAALAMAKLYETAKSNPIHYLRNSSHAERLAAMGLKRDIRYCLSLDKTTIIPILRGKYLEKM